MQWQIVGGESFPLLKVDLEKGETIKAEAGAMVSMSAGLALTGKRDGGSGRALARMFTGDSFFLQSITAEKSRGTVQLTTPMPGGIMPVTLDPQKPLVVQ